MYICIYVHKGSNHSAKLSKAQPISTMFLQPYYQLSEGQQEFPSSEVTLQMIFLEWRSYIRVRKFRAQIRLHRTREGFALSIRLQLQHIRKLKVSILNHWRAQLRLERRPSEDPVELEWRSGMSNVWDRTTNNNRHSKKKVMQSYIQYLYTYIYIYI